MNKLNMQIHQRLRDIFYDAEEEPTHICANEIELLCQQDFLTRALKVVDNRIKTIRGDVSFIAEESLIEALKAEFENE